MGLMYCTAFVSSAQSDSTASIIPDYVLKYSLGSLFDPVLPAFQVAGEYRIAKTVTIQHELGFLVDLRNNFSGTPLGLRLRNEIRFYITRPLKPFDTYIGLQLMGRYINSPNQKVTVNRFSGSFFQQLDTRVKYFDWGPLVTLGNVYYFEKLPMTLEVGFAFGIRYNYYNYTTDLPSDARVISNGFFASLNPTLAGFFDQAGALGTRQLSFKIGYRINK